MATLNDLLVTGSARVVGPIYGTIEQALKLKNSQTINGTSFDGTAPITTSTWGPNVSFTITDGTNISTAVTSTGNPASVAIKLPSTIKATFTGNLTGNVTGNVSGSSGSCTGNSATASALNHNVTLTFSDGSDISGSFTLNTINSTAYTSSDITVKDNSHNHRYLRGWPDSRNIVTTPNDYNGYLSVVGIKEKTASALTAHDTSSTYSTLVGIRGWSDSSGGNSHELAFDGAGSIFHRHGATTEWNDWTKLMESTQAIPYIVGPSTDATEGTWTGTYPGIKSYVDGLTIIYVPAVAGASTTTLNINGLGAKTCYLTNTTKLTTQFSVNTPIMLTYVGEVWKRADYDSNTNTQIRVYRRSGTTYNKYYPLIASNTIATSIGTPGKSGTYTSVYGLIPDDSSDIPSINPHSGSLKAHRFVGNLSGNASTATTATTADKAEALRGTASTTIVPIESLEAGYIKYFYNVNTGLTGNMPTSSNANSILQLNTHSGDYHHQLGFSSDGNIYHRASNGTALSDSVTWNAVLTSSNYSSYISKLLLPSPIDSQSALDSFLSPLVFRVGYWNNFTPTGLISNGFIISNGWTSDTYGYQIAIDDDPTYKIYLRQKSSSWSDWKMLPMADGTNASGDWDININGIAASASTDEMGNNLLDYYYHQGNIIYSATEPENPVEGMIWLQPVN